MAAILTPEEMAHIHRLSFTLPRPWSAAEITAHYDQRGSMTFCHEHGFLLARHVAGEVELLTTAVHPDYRRQGLARKLLRDLLAAATGMGAEAVFLEVAHRNKPAISLYEKAGFAQVGRRKAYYDKATDALVMRHDLTGDSRSAQL